MIVKKEEELQGLKKENKELKLYLKEMLSALKDRGDFDILVKSIEEKIN